MPLDNDDEDEYDGSQATSGEYDVNVDIDTPFASISSASGAPPLPQQSISAELSNGEDSDDFTDEELRQAPKSSPPAPAPPLPAAPAPPPPAAAPAPPPAPARAPSREQQTFLKSRPNTFAARLAEATLQGKDRVADEGLVPVSAPGLLHWLAKQKVPTLAVELSAYLLALVRECELIGREGGKLREPSNVKDMRVLLHQLDDFALEYRPGGKGAVDLADFDADHQLGVFLARMKLLNVLENCVSERESASVVDKTIADRLSIEAEQISDSQLALWLFRHKVCHLSALVNRRGVGNDSVPGHRLQQMTLSCFWETLIRFMDGWQRLPADAYVVRFFNEMRRRCAFFCSYREEVASASLERHKRGKSTILGLTADLFELLDMAPPTPTPAAAESRSRVDLSSSSSLIDNFELASVDEETGFAAVNSTFFSQCEAIFHFMQVELRQALGFRFADESDERCLVCQMKLVITESHVARLEKLIADELSGSARDTLTDEFQDAVLSRYVQPSEMAQFKAMRPSEVQTPFNCIARERKTDFERLRKQFLAAEPIEVWRNSLAVAGQRTEPAYEVLAVRALNCHTQRLYGGASFAAFYIESFRLAPFLYVRERCRQWRDIGQQLHTLDVTTSTLLFRQKLMLQGGLSSAPDERNYQLPLVLRSFNSHFVIYNGHVHRVADFAHAFLIWLHCVCTDRHVRGSLPRSKQFLLFPLYREMFPERAVEIDVLEKNAVKKISDYNPFRQMLKNVTRRHVASSSSQKK